MPPCPCSVRMDPRIFDAVVVLKTAKLEGDRLTVRRGRAGGDLTGGDGPASLFIDRFGFGGSLAGSERVGYGRARRPAASGVPENRPYVARGAWFRGAAVGAAAVGAAAAAPYYGAPCGYHPYPPCY